MWNPLSPRGVIASRSTPVTEAGVKFKWPWPIQRVVRYDKRERILEGAEEELRTLREASRR